MCKLLERQKYGLTFWNIILYLTQSLVHSKHTINVLPTFSITSNGNEVMRILINLADQQKILLIYHLYYCFLKENFTLVIIIEFNSRKKHGD